MYECSGKAGEELFSEGMYSENILETPWDRKTSIIM